MKKLKEFYEKNNSGIFILIIIFLMLVPVFIWLPIAVSYDSKPHRPELSTDQKIDMIADHIGVEFKYVEPQAGYWKIKQSLRFRGEISIPNPTSSNMITGNLADVPILIYPTER